MLYNLQQLMKASLVGIAVLILASSCTKLVEVSSPANTTAGENVFNNDDNATGLMTSVFHAMAMASVGNAGPFNGVLPSYTALSADEMELYSGVYAGSPWIAYYQNNMQNITGDNDYTYFRAYQLIYTANAVINGVTASESLSPHVKKQLLGEAHFIRGYNYFYLAALWGDVPVTTTTDYIANAHVMRSRQDSVFDFAMSDLEEAQGLLSDQFLAFDLKTGTNERVRPTSYAASALLARVYLHRGMFDKAATAASKCIDNSSLFDTVSLDNVFLMNNKETIWALQPTSTEYNTSEGSNFVIRETGWNSYQQAFALSKMLVDSFETGDGRWQHWVGKWTDKNVTPNVDHYYCYKYKSYEWMAPLTEYEVLFRLAEQYLIRAEARAQLGQTSGAAADLDIIRKRAGLPATAAATAEELVNAVRHERMIELFFEGHRWMDLKRSGNIDAIMTVATPIKSGGAIQWRSFQQLYPIPAAEIQRVKGLTQNEGY